MICDRVKSTPQPSQITLYSDTGDVTLLGCSIAGTSDNQNMKLKDDNDAFVERNAEKKRENRLKFRK